MPSRSTRPAPRAPADSRAAEARLVAAARRGDRAALTRLVEHVAGPAGRFSRGFCRDPHDAEDLVQSVLTTLLRTLSSFRGEASLSTWTYVVARRACARLRRRGARQVTLPPDDRTLVEAPDPRAGPHRQLERRQLAAALEHAIAALPAAQREVLVLRDVEGRPAAEVAGILGLGERAVKSRLHRARLVLRERLAPFVGAAHAPVPAPDCPDTVRLLSRYLEGELSASTCARMEEHVRSCAACEGACRSLRDVLGACRAYGTRPLPADVRSAVRRAVRDALAVRR